MLDGEPDRTIHSDLNLSLRGGFSEALQRAVEAAIAAVEISVNQK